RRKEPGGAGPRRGPRYIQRAAQHDPALAQGRKSAAGDRLRRRQRGLFPPEPVSDTRSQNAGLLNVRYAVFGIVEPATGSTLTLLSLPNFFSAASRADCGSLKGAKPICRISSWGQLETT